MKKRNKYGNIRSYGWDSQAERGCFDWLNLLVAAKRIASVRHHPPAIKWASASWKIDFLVTANDGTEFYVEYKGMPTAYYKIKLKWFVWEKVAPIFIVVGNTRSGYKVDASYLTAGIEFP